MAGEIEEVVGRRTWRLLWVMEHEVSTGKLLMWLDFHKLNIPGNQCPD